MVFEKNPLLPASHLKRKFLTGNFNESTDSDVVWETIPEGYSHLRLNP